MAVGGWNAGLWLCMCECGGRGLPLGGRGVTLIGGGIVEFAAAGIEGVREAVASGKRPPDWLIPWLSVVGCTGPRLGEGPPRPSLFTPDNARPEAAADPLL